jgi:hypothetical protein
MNSILKQIIFSWWLAASFGFPAAVSAQSLRPSQIQQVNSGLFRSNSQDFFQQGYRQLEREIAILLQKMSLPKAIFWRLMKNCSLRFAAKKLKYPRRILIQ